MSRSALKGRSAFTLVELLVVLAIISILMAVLMPALKKAKLAADGIKCANNVRTLMTSFLLFGQDHGGVLPGNKHDSDDRRGGRQPARHKEDWKTDWMMGRIGTGLAAVQGAPTKGTIWPYVRKKEVWVCPSMESSTGTYALGAGSNERFDYAVFNIFAGNKVAKIKTRAQYTDNRSGARTWVPTPIIVQEHERSINGDNIEGGHSESDKMAVVHNGGSYYASHDGSVHYFQEWDDPTLPLKSQRDQQKNTARKSWMLHGPKSGVLQTMGVDLGWAEWDDK